MMIKFIFLFKYVKIREVNRIDRTVRCSKNL